MVFVNSKRQVRSIIITNPNPANPCIFKGKTPKVIIHLHCLIPRNTGKLMTPAKQNNNLQQQKSRKFGNQVTILRSIFDFHRHQKSTRVHHTAHCRVHTRTPRRLQVVCFLCAFFLDALLLMIFLVRDLNENIFELIGLPPKYHEEFVMSVSLSSNFHPNQLH